jgi:hypothetical protein
MLQKRQKENKDYLCAKVQNFFHFPNDHPKTSWAMQLPSNFFCGGCLENGKKVVPLQPKLQNYRVSHN